MDRATPPAYNVICGGFEDHFRGIRGDLVFCDPPYNLGINCGTYDDTLDDGLYLEYLSSWVSAAVDATHEDHGVLAFMISEEYADFVGMALSDRMEKVQRIIWHETFHTYHERT